jgi:hypothetical protein
MLLIYEDESIYGPDKDGSAVQQIVAKHMALHAVSMTPVGAPPIEQRGPLIGLVVQSAGASSGASVFVPASFACPMKGRSKAASIVFSSE